MSKPVEHPRVVMVTGATSGIGQATALLLLSLGHHVAGLGRNAERLATLATHADSLPGELLPLEGDVTDGNLVQRLAAQTLAHFGRLEVLVANAGIGHRGKLAEARWEDIERVLRTNIDGVVHSIRACIPPMRAGGGGHILTISSVVGPVPTPGAAVYAMSKAAIDSLSQSLRMELRNDDIWVTNMIVGQTATEFAKRRLGRSGKVARRLPTMPPERVAAQLVRAMDRRRRTVIIRPIDRLIVLAGRFTPWLMDRILYRVYG
ncbi:MAG: SDR family NAD(P)-dependent oxidoreductase [Chloroflexi bacterium]|nr:SDR family NAD(P)-dependent oxidoreductase [Chloroflexota bacterium]